MSATITPKPACQNPPHQSEDLSRLQRRVSFLESALSKERTRTTDLEESLTAADGRLADAAARCDAYERGVYGLPQAAAEIRQLKEVLAGAEARVRATAGVGPLNLEE
jgi:hypothetical protein